MPARRIQNASLTLGVVAAVLAAALPAQAEWEGMMGIEPIMPRWTNEQRQHEMQEMALRGLNPSERIRRMEQLDQIRAERTERLGDTGRMETERGRIRGQAPAMGANPVQEAQDHIRQARESMANDKPEEAADHVLQAEAMIRRIDDGGHRHVRRFLDALERDMVEAREGLRLRSQDAEGRLERIESRIRSMTPREMAPEER